ncbi:serine/threonine protein phosphatase Pzh1 [Mucor velutinosus]|uniref:Serine/threonine protein phosphatase Pzh1 n=1 Tax=Mucor velutinosus TaxID=708070 RepID=A0AAN7D522_9FUNG|nr:serine/threonine protein phosphatase Pzh1 [Mucor velutinosus]
MSTVALPSSADDSHKQQLAERSEESEYETISQDEDLGSPTVTPYTIDDDFSFSSPHPLKRTTRSHEEPTTSSTVEQPKSTIERPKSTISTPSFKEHSQEQVAHEGGASHHQAEASAKPSAAAKSTFLSTPSVQPAASHREGANRQDGQGFTPKFSNLSQNTQESLPNNQQATMSPNTRANLSQEASGQRPIASPRDSVNQQQQREGGHHHHVHIRIFILQRRVHGAFAVLMYHLLNVLKIMFFASILYYMYTKEMIPLPPLSGREKLYVLKRM